MIGHGFLKAFDGFYANPSLVRKMALRGYWKRQPGEFRGFVCEVDQFPASAVLAHIAHLLRQPICYRSAKQGQFRSLNLDQQASKSKQVHIDRIGIAAIVCLSPDSEGKIRFLRHRKFGICHLEQVREAADAIGASVAEVEATLELDANDLDRWETIQCLEHRFNRLLVFDSNLYHVAASGYGANREEAKLTQNFSFTKSLCELSPNEEMAIEKTPAMISSNAY